MNTLGSSMIARTSLLANSSLNPFLDGADL